MSGRKKSRYGQLQTACSGCNRAIAIRHRKAGIQLCKPCAKNPGNWNPLRAGKIYTMPNGGRND